MEPTAHPKEREEREHQVDGEKLAELIPRYHVVLLDDEDHTYQYVVEMLMRLFRHGRKMSWKMASEVDQRGRVIVFATNKEQAEHKREARSRAGVPISVSWAVRVRCRPSSKKRIRHRRQAC